jgi:hypothetical protein
MFTAPRRPARAAIVLLVGLLVGGFLGGGAVWVLNRSKLKDANTIADVSLAKAPELELVPADGVAFGHVRLADLWRTEAFVEFRKMVDKAGADAIKAFDESFVPAPSTADRLTVFAFKSPDGSGPHVCGILAFSAPFEESKVRAANFSESIEQESGGKKFTVGRNGFAAHFHSDRVIVVGTPASLNAYFAMKPKSEGALAGALALAAGGTRHVVAAGSTSLAADLPPDIPAEFRPLLQAESITVGLVLGGGAKIDVRAAYASSVAAEAAEKSLRAAAAEGRKKIAEFKKKFETGAKGEPEMKKHRPIQEFPEAAGSLFGLGAMNSVEEWLADPPLTREGNEIAVTFTTGSMGSTYLGLSAASVGLMLPAVQKVREAAARASDSNNLKQIGLAFHSYSDTIGRLPETEWGFKPGDPKFKGGLSWRVAILPYIEQDALYRQFKLDEPWDSEHNKKLIPLMPKTYLSPLMPTEPGKTYYKTFVGGGAMFGRPNRYTVGNVPDGSSNTIMVAEGGDPVIWTKPEDFEYDPKKPVPRIAAPGKQGFNVLMGDGSVRWVKATVREETLRIAIVADDGMVLPPDW